MNGAFIALNTCADPAHFFFTISDPGINLLELSLIMAVDAKGIQEGDPKSVVGEMTIGKEICHG